MAQSLAEQECKKSFYARLKVADAYADQRLHGSEDTAKCQMADVAARTGPATPATPIFGLDLFLPENNPFNTTTRNALSPLHLVCSYLVFVPTN